MEKKKVVIIGGGFAGSYIAKKLQNIFNVTLIDIKDYFEFTPGILRAIIKPSHIKKLQALHHNYLKKTKIILGKVTEADKKKVKVNNKLYFYDYLVICSGSKYNTPMKEHNEVIIGQAKHLIKYYSKLKNSKNILIIGGGLVGVELAGEICTKYKNIKIILIDSKNRLMKRNNIKSSKYAQKFLEKRGVEIILNEKIISNKKIIYFTNKGRKLKTDMVFLCTGITPNSKFMQKQFSKILDKRGYIKVNESLQLLGQKNIFVVGDVNDLLEEKTAQNAKIQAKIAIKNILSYKKGEKLVKYKPKKTILIISLGKHNGIFEYKNFILKGFFPGIMKSFIERSVMKKYN